MVLKVEVKLAYTLKIDGIGYQKTGETVYILLGNGIVRIRKRVVLMGQTGKWVHGGGNLGRKRSRYGIRDSMEWLAYGNGNRHSIAGIKTTGG
jgi:hypothetical protein